MHRRTHGCSRKSNCCTIESDEHICPLTETLKVVEALVQPWSCVHTNTDRVQSTAPYGAKGLTAAGQWEGARRGSEVNSARHALGVRCRTAAEPRSPRGVRTLAAADPKRERVARTGQCGARRPRERPCTKHAPRR